MGRNEKAGEIAADQVDCYRIVRFLSIFQRKLCVNYNRANTCNKSVSQEIMTIQKIQQRFSFLKKK